MYIACTYRMAVHGVVMDFPWTDHGSLDNQVDEAIVRNSAAVASIKAALKTFCYSASDCILVPAFIQFFYCYLTIYHFLCTANLNRLRNRHSIITIISTPFCITQHIGSPWNRILVR